MTLAMEHQPKVEGIYAAFDPTPTDVIALAACDDDGDPVVVLSDPFLSLVDSVAEARAIDDVFGTSKVQDYAVFLARKQSSGARPLPPPAGLFEAAQTADPRVKARFVERRDEALGAVVAHEIAHVVQEDLKCPHPTAAREIGDTIWTAQEARAAIDVASHGVYAAHRVLAADAMAADLLLASGASRDPTAEEAYVAVLTVFDHLPMSAYARLHQVPGTMTAGSVRTSLVRAAAKHWRDRPHAPSNAVSSADGGAP
jgi:hypothetical protein